MARRRVIAEELTAETPAPNSVDLIRWRVPVEVDSIAVGNLFLSSNTAIERY
ncbi:MAG: hypothetical protein ABSC51_00200 [Gaiellaceae bacterium]|jgi:hypothetical protein